MSVVAAGEPPSYQHGYDDGYYGRGRSGAARYDLAEQGEYFDGYWDGQDAFRASHASAAPNAYSETVT